MTRRAEMVWGEDDNKSRDGEELTDMDDSDLERLAEDAGWGSSRIFSDRGTWR